MSKLPDILCRAWENREGPVVFTTIDKNDNPNAIYVTSVKMLNEQNIVIADNFFDKTRANIFAGSRGAVLYITKEGKSYQLKGTIEYFKDGEVYEDMMKWADPQYPRVAAALLKVEEAYSGSEKIL
ncbi:MAG TPA: pyridoxamine 5'-phosphate oxidase family protein [Nitrospiria bacterium]|nr:pyridoxamine 5'-phosphate oxidase family protein [Nitrospiria bacterium]